MRRDKGLAMTLLIALAVGLLIGLLVGALLERIGDREEAASPLPAVRTVTVEKPVPAPEEKPVPAPEEKPVPAPEEKTVLATPATATATASP